ncbi:MULTISPECIES: 4-hydroxy-tetrahydrodipicolinate synthase [Prosthecochloris]|uniref:4-hydroxy-tetrahydrodipicolinate synthase n=1 Tax=Prosthecochloris vibrioformis TaxID=1098 RepID=A0A5C4S264_PROVB|nr:MULTISPECIES: 4-hydroxy-tetrahydrodipicolinate synthase [Prosthecochloris]ANT64356.1 4-hydroxy-tetrahydrodipicolinate synthase [Prosthecochloris sp. CIB 2401]TNJ37212.1 4-hydroxy-tetrahydrodipicolinate synthase [Prosthecochloris vibrioformis]
MSHTTISGLAVALVTPFTRENTIDEGALRRLVGFHKAAGTDIILPCGTTGESPTLSEEEQARIISIVREETDGSMLVAAGAGTNDTRKAVKLAISACEAGAEAILSVAPYYNKPSQEGYYQHYRHIAESIDVPLIIYNVPGRTGGNVHAETILRLAEECENVAAVKEASDNMEQIMDLLHYRPEGFSVMTGEDSLIMPFMALGGDGAISVAANQLPREVRQLMELSKNGNLAEARALNRRLQNMFRLNFIESNPVPVKYCLSLMGMVEETYRLPLVPMDEENKRLLKAELERLGLIS